MQFPSVEWFEAVSAKADEDAETFERLGWCDATVGIDVRDGAEAQSFVLTFEGYRCVAVEEVDGDALAAADFTLRADHDVWREMVENVRENGRADLEHTLNHLQLPSIIELVAEDQGQADLFYRYNQTFQEFFNKAATVPTEFAARATAAG